MTLKDKILNSLLDGEISGETLAVRYGVTRAAIWKAIKALGEEGYIINAGTNRGYSLVDSDVLSNVGIKRGLSTEWEIETLGKTTSTNAIAKIRATEGKGNYAVVADSQSSGRGRYARCFFSPEKTGLYMSALIRPNLPVTMCGYITAYAAVVVAHAIEKLSGANVQIKWVNDLFINGKKICGILTEGGVGMEGGILDYAIVGIGINVNRTEFPAELQTVATTIETETGTKIDRCALCAEILNGLCSLPAEINSRRFIIDYKRRSCVIGKKLVVNGDYEATALDIDDDCALIVKTTDGVINKLTAGEVSIKLQ